MKQAYRLNLPSIDQVCDPAAFAEVLHTNAGHLVKPVQNLFKPQWQMIAGWNLTGCSVFKKNNQKNTLHADDNAVLRKPTQPPLWGINWVWQNTATLDFWHPDLIESWQRVSDTVGTYNILCKTTHPPSERYEMQHGEAWLVNASCPHRAGAKGQRWVFSARSTLSHMDKLGWTWSDVVNSFQELITQ